MGLDVQTEPFNADDSWLMDDPPEHPERCYLRIGQRYIRLPRVFNRFCRR